MKGMLGLTYEPKYRIWMIYDLKLCSCGNHVCKSLIVGGTKEKVLHEIQEMMKNDQ